MAITSEIIGKLGGSGGGDMEKIPVDVTASGKSDSEEVFHTVEVPAGETWLVAAYGNLKSGALPSSLPQIIVGTTELPARTPSGVIGVAHFGTGTINVKLRRNTATGSDSFTGHVYTVKM